MTTETLLGETGGYVVEAGEKGTISDQRKMDDMVTQLSAMFAGGEIDEESKKAAIDALNEAYWIATADNKKRYTPKKYRKEKDGDNPEG